MSKIEEVKEWIEDYLDWEIAIRKSSFDPSICETEHSKNFDKYASFFSDQWRPIVSGGLSTRHLDTLEPEVVKKNHDSRVRRRLFIIREYESSRFGDGIVTDSNSFFSCYVSKNTIWNKVLSYGPNICVSIIGGNLKIICIRRSKKASHSAKKVEWEVHPRSSAVSDGYVVLQEGKLINTLRVTPPEHQPSLDDYLLD